MSPWRRTTAFGSRRRCSPTISCPSTSRRWRMCARGWKPRRKAGRRPRRGFFSRLLARVTARSDIVAERVKRVDIKSTKKPRRLERQKSESDAPQPRRPAASDVSDDRADGAAESATDPPPISASVALPAAFSLPRAASAFSPTKPLKLSLRSSRLKYGALGSPASRSERSVSYKPRDVASNASRARSISAATRASSGWGDPSRGSVSIAPQTVRAIASVASTDCVTEGRSRKLCAPRAARNARCARCASPKSTPSSSSSSSSLSFFAVIASILSIISEKRASTTSVCR
mmetsp:Transcript_13835/g.59203  ORF Transcript_13835/g.59203 Transcript_13835/m.59203 type:complete len:289 (-) Transcript_13835:108-974(-)